MDITRVAPDSVDLDLAELLAGVDRDSLQHAGLEVTAPTGPSRMTSRGHRRGGLGSRLLEQAVAFAREQGGPR